MKIIKTQQGTDAWRYMRQDWRTASEASAMMCASKNTTRDELLFMKATATEKEFTDWFQKNILDKGHEIEAQARLIAEEIIGEELFPLTATDDDGWLSASFDGITMLEDIIWECKSLNHEKISYVLQGEIPPTDFWQVVQQLVISGAEKALYMVTNGTPEKTFYCWYELDTEAEKKLIAGWKQFDNDLASYNYKEAEYQHNPAPDAQKSLPALFIDIEGQVTNTNLAAYEHAVTAKIQEISTDLKTDDDFANAEEIVKFLDNAEKEIEIVKNAALAKTASIDELFKTLDHLKEEMRRKRLDLNKLVTNRKKEIKTDIAMEARAEVDAYIEEKCKQLGYKLPKIITDFNTAMKSKRTLINLKSAAHDEVARAKIEINNHVEIMLANIKTYEEYKKCHSALFPDIDSLLIKEPDSFTAIVKHRINEFNQAQQVKLLEDEKAAVIAEKEALLEAQELAKHGGVKERHYKIQVLGTYATRDENSAEIHTKLKAVLAKAGMTIEGLYVK